MIIIDRIFVGLQLLNMILHLDIEYIIGHS